MRVVAIRAVHKAFIHPMFRRHGELAPHRGVAPVAQVGLALCQEELGGRCFVDRMATSARDVTQGVDRTADICSRQGLTMTSKAPVQGLLGREH